MTSLSGSHPNYPHTISRVLYSVLCILLFLSACGPQTTPTSIPVPPTGTFTPDSSPSEAPTQTPYIITATPQADVTLSASQGAFFLSMADAGHTHIFAYSPQSLSLTRLTTGEWDDITPALSPDGTRVAFASDRNGYWDIYSLDLQSGEISRLTDTREYDSNPSWSLPDAAFITYESYVNGNLEIFIRSVTDSAQVYNLTQDPATDTSPAWSPQGRQIAFVSNRSGEPEIWVANLDTAGDFKDISNAPQSAEAHPAWSPDGNQLAWASTDLASGLTGIYIWDVRSPNVPARWVGSGDWSVWQSLDHLAISLATPNQAFLAGYDINQSISLPPVLLPGPINGLTFGNVLSALPGPFQSNAQITPAPLYNTVLNPQPGILPGRSSLAPLLGIQAPYPQLHELADDSFQALRNQVAISTGWDALASLENAFIPLTTSLDPGLGEDWLYTGRAFTLNPALIEAGWMAVVREDFGQQTYWRIYLRTTAQDGSQGAPLTRVPWDFAARTGDPGAYENGGRLMASVPTGYYFDLTALAIQYGWERLPALTNWRTYYSGARFNELAFTQGLDWRSAMLQLYPPEVLVTPTVVIPLTRTPTRVPPFYQSPTPTLTPTLRPTNTP